MARQHIVKEEQDGTSSYHSKFMKTQCQLKLFPQVESLTKTVDVQIAQYRLEIPQEIPSQTVGFKKLKKN